VKRSKQNRFGILAVLLVLTATACDSNRGTVHAAHLTTRAHFAVSVSSYARPRWSGLILVDPLNRRCTNVPLPGSPSYITFSGRRYVYSTGPKSYWLGTIGGPPPRRFRTKTRGLPYWLDGQIGFVGGFSRKLHLGAHTVNLDVPHGAQVDNFTASRGRIAFQAWWGDARAGTGRSGIYVYAHGAQRKVAQRPQPAFSGDQTNYGLLGWTPNGRRLLLDLHNNLWTALPNGTKLRTLTHFAPLSSPYQGNYPIWSPDGRYLAFVGGADNSPPETYVVRADGMSPVRRLSHSRSSSGPSGQQNGTVPLTWLSPSALAVAHQFSIGILGLDGSFHPICKRDGVTFLNGVRLR